MLTINHDPAQEAWMTHYSAHRAVTCKGCGGVAECGPSGGAPTGWYGLTVAVPAEISTGSGRGYIWVGMFCSVACLASATPQLERQEQLAHQAYEPVRPKAGRR
jgi:hypothetical protein